jgi:hypothetical protein
LVPAGPSVYAARAASRPPASRRVAGGRTRREHGLSATARTVLAIAVVAAIVAALFVSGWADDEAQPGSRGRGQVSAPATTP